MSVVTILLVHNIFALYAEVLCAGDILWEYNNKEKGQPDVLSFTEEQSDLAYQFIFDSEFKNINANITVFEEHRNLNSNINFNPGHILSLTVPDYIAGNNFTSTHTTYCLSVPYSCNQELHGNLYSFRI